MPERPTGTVSFLFTDIEGSTRLWEQHPVSMKGALARHDEIARSATVDAGGYVLGFELRDEDVALIDSLDSGKRVGPDPDDLDF